MKCVKCLPTQVAQEQLLSRASPIVLHEINLSVDGLEAVKALVLGDNFQVHLPAFQIQCHLSKCHCQLVVLVSLPELNMSKAAPSWIPAGA